MRSANYNVVIGRDEAEVQERLGWIRNHYTNAGLPADVVDSTVKSFEDGPLVGTPEQIVETLVDLQARGMTLRHHLLRRAGLRHLGRRAVRAAGHPGVHRAGAARQPVALHARAVGSRPVSVVGMWPALVVPYAAAAVLLAVAGVPKVRDPGDLVRAVRSVGMPFGRSAVRAFAAAEVVVAVAALGGAEPAHRRRCWR